VADVVDVLLAQHALIEDLFRETLTATGSVRQERFDELVRVLTVHETAEQAVVHPAALERIDDGAGLVEGHVTEEVAATQLMGTLVEMGTDGEGFDAALLALRLAVLVHARHEERYEFTRLRHAASRDEMTAMVETVRAAEAAAARP
jgi:hemerythrin superfamily protein